MNQPIDPNAFQDELPEELVRRLRSWPEPPLDDRPMEDRVVAALRDRGHLDRAAERRRRWRPALAAAALATTAIGGFALGRVSATAPDDRAGAEDRRARFVLLLRERVEAPPAGGRAEADLTDRYTRWAARQRADGIVEMGAKLADESTVVGSPGEDSRISGFFVIRARSLAEAMDLARSTPHHERGAPIEIRPIVDTTR